MFGLPHLPKGAKWRVICNTGDPDVTDLPTDGTCEVPKNQMMLAVPPRGIVILESFDGKNSWKKNPHHRSEDRDIGLKDGDFCMI